MLDENNYPDEASLKEIEEWDILKKGVLGLLDLIRENTNWDDRQIHISGKRVLRFEYHTGGWSGNESVIGALSRNFLFWAMFWQKSTRGGHYYFKMEKLKMYEGKKAKFERLVASAEKAPKGSFLNP